MALSTRVSLRCFLRLSVVNRVRTCSVLAPITLEIATDQNESILVNWNREKQSRSVFHYDWLRENCQCPKCRHTETGQRVWRIKEDARPDSVQFLTDNGKMEIKWKDGHVSQFTRNWLLENSYCHHNIDNVRPAATKKPALTLWDAEYFNNRELPSVDYEEYMKSDEVLLKMLQKFRQYGLCFIHNTPASEEATGDAIRRIGPLRRTYYGDVWSMVAGSMAVNDLAYSSGLLDLHTDNCYLVEPPGLLAFHCVEYKGEGGESMLVDGFSVAEHIRQTHPEYFTLLSKVSILFKVDYGDGFYHSRKTFFDVNYEGEIIRVNYNYLDKQPFDAQSFDEMKNVLGCDSNKGVVTYYKALRLLHSLLYGDKFLYEFKLLPGTLLVFNNHRLLHGRRALNGHRKLCGTSVDSGELESKLKLLENTS